MTLSIDQKSLKKQIAKIADDYANRNAIAEYRTLNIVSKRGKAQAARLVSADTGYKISTIKRALKTRNATKRNAVAVWNMSGSRLQFPGVRVVKRKSKPAGVSHIGLGKKRIKQLNYIGKGSKPFVIKGQHSSKKVAVFRKKGYKRKVTSYQGHSVPFMMKKSWKAWLKEWVRLELVKEYPKQLDKAKYT